MPGALKSFTIFSLSLSLLGLPCFVTSFALDSLVQGPQAENGRPVFPGPAPSTPPTTGCVWACTQLSSPSMVALSLVFSHLPMLLSGQNLCLLGGLATALALV